MPTENDFRCDTEFVKLLSRRTDVDLTIAALELARDAYPDLDFAATLSWIEDRAAELSAAVARAGSERKVLQELARALAGDHGIQGDADCYERADSSYLNRVIETGRGIPISLSVLYMAVAGRLGIDLKGVSTPWHFLTRYESVDGPLFVDPFSGGRIMTRGKCVKWLESITKLPAAELKSTLRPARPRDIVIRMLGNLKAIYTRQEQWRAAWMVQHRLTVLQPSDYQERRDLATISLRAQRPGPAIDLLRSCLHCCPEEERELLQRQLAEAMGRIAAWN